MNNLAYLALNVITDPVVSEAIGQRVGECIGDYYFSHEEEIDRKFNDFKAHFGFSVYEEGVRLGYINDTTEVSLRFHQDGVTPYFAHKKMKHPISRTFTYSGIYNTVKNYQKTDAGDRNI